MLMKMFAAVKRRYLERQQRIQFQNLLRRLSDRERHDIFTDGFDPAQ